MALPIFLTWENLLKHCLLLGGTGSGKSMLVLASLAGQMIRRANAAGDTSLIVIDFKGDRALFSYMRALAANKKVPFKWFTTNKNFSSYAMNPFLQDHWNRDLTRSQKAQTIANSLGLNMGRQYGASYFHSIGLLILRATMRFKEIDSFTKLNQYLKRYPEFLAKLDLPRNVREDSSHLMATVDELAQFESLNASPNWCNAEVMKHSIQFQEVFSKAQVNYFYLPAPLEDGFAIAKLVCYLTLSAAAMRPADKPGNKVFLMIDEAQRVISPDLVTFLEMARGFNIGCILSMQSHAHLNNVSGEFAEIIESNCNVKISLSALTRNERDRLIDNSPRVLSLGSEVEEALVDKNELDAMNADKFSGMFQVAQHDPGYTQFGGQQVAFRPQFVMSERQYHKFKRQPWPSQKDSPGTILVSGNPPPGYDADDAGSGVPGAGHPPKKPSGAKLGAVPASPATPKKKAEFQARARRVLRDS